MPSLPGTLAAAKSAAHALKGRATPAARATADAVLRKSRREVMRQPPTKINPTTLVEIKASYFYCIRISAGPAAGLLPEWYSQRSRGCAGLIYRACPEPCGGRHCCSRSRDQ